ncbi:DUF6924 domain-containing protein [Rhodococcus sp. NPDC003994]
MTRTLPSTGESLLVRTDFSDDERWRAMVDAATRPWDSGDGEYTAALTLVDDPAFDGLTPADVTEVVGSPPPYYVFLADADTMADPERSILAVDTADTSVDPPTFRVHPSQMPAVENNLFIANLGFDDFASAVGADGVFRGFTPPRTARTLDKTALLEAIDGSSAAAVPADAIEIYRASLTQWPRPGVDGLYVHARDSHDEQVRRRQHNDYRYNSWVIGLDETITALADRGDSGQLVIAGFPTAVTAAIADRPVGHCSVWVDSATLVPVAVLATGNPDGWPTA